MIIKFCLEQRVSSRILRSKTANLWGISLTLPRVDGPDQRKVVTINAIKHDYGAELSQLQDGEQKTIAFFRFS